ncbi:LRR_4 domain-containing protein [Cephalotus follicularis]|uniref:LRR_4 domain-containing protein n=1 Tax=Cephalotus follicularis TaxID=3775 RepID=A0A1Q3CKK3_CEPFO|nr:LRR_4 domain-containing protein [Cephalotus follicularis]
MVRFSCFNAHINCHKPKKPVQHSVETMQKTLPNRSQIQASGDSPNNNSLNSLLLKAQGDSQSNDCSSSVDRAYKSEEIKGEFNYENDKGCLKKSQSLGCKLYLEGRVPSEINMEDETDQGNSFDSHEENRLVVPNGGKDPGESTPSQSQVVPHSESVQVSSDLVHNDSIFSIGDPLHSEKVGHENSDDVLYGDCAEESGGHTPRTPSMIVKSCSVPYFHVASHTSGGRSPFKYLAPQSRSSEDLHVLDMRRKEMSIHEAGIRVMREEDRDDGTSKPEKNNFEISADDGYDSYNYSASAKDWIMPVMNEVNSVRILEGESSAQQFKYKRIEAWVNELHHCTPLGETEELSHSHDQVKIVSNLLNGLTAAKVDSKVTPGMEAAKRYISSLGASATTAQLANHGLVVIPFFSAFLSLRVLNLSGNAIVRITAGALPRGLHMLNLSKNNISTIEGLRELTRLRVLDLSYNRILRIGHGLASCASLKELYLAGNKISEVEGLHRLLKLTVLDLRFNKISTAKCLGQLAANYISLQAISLEGNPAQKNVGDEQLKKHLQGLLPHLAYFNRQPIKFSTLKDAADRSVRLGISDRASRSELKSTRKGNHGLAAARPSASSTQGRKSPAVVSPKRSSRGRHVRLPPAPSGTKAVINRRHNYFDFGSKLLNFKSELSIRRSRSEGTLGAV